MSRPIGPPNRGGSKCPVRLTGTIRLLAVAALSVCALVGCTRKFYRNRADREVDCVISSKDQFDKWKVEQYHVYPDERARFGDPTNPDRPPMPYDDLATASVSPNPQHPGKSGCGMPDGTVYLELIANWDGENRAKKLNDSARDDSNIPGLVAPPKKTDDSRELALKTGEKAYLLTLDQASELALINSREFQDHREDLYLAALPVTLERFAFAAQFFATEQVIREHTGADTPEGHGNRWRANTGAGVSKLFCTGALLVFQFANQVVINFAANNGPKLVTPSNLSLDLTQPLLQGGGKAVTLEPLTQTERNLVYVMRAYARFRKEFYVYIAAGGTFGLNLAPGGPLAPSAAAPAEGYLATLLRGAVLVNSKNNVRYLESILALFQALLRGGDVSQLQVDQVELEMLNRQADVLVQTQQLRDALDRFKLQLGVPMTVPLELDDSIIRPLVNQQARFLEVISQFDSLRSEISRSNPAEITEKLRERLHNWVTESALGKNTQVAQEFPRRWREVEQLSDNDLAERLKQQKASRDELEDREAELFGKNQDLPAEERARLVELGRDIELGQFEQVVRSYLARPWLLAGNDEARQKSIQAAAYREMASSFIVVLSDARNERIEGLKKQWPKLPGARLCGADLITEDFDQAIAAVSQAALANRLDLMNRRAIVVDAWRQIAVDANALMGVLNVQYHLDSGTKPDTQQPFAFQGSRTRHQLIFTGELPLVRVAERNAYRTALIAFQRSRRTLQSAEDLAVSGVRSELRQLRVLSENYKIQQRAVELSYYQVENSLNVLQAPPRPLPAGASGASGTTGSGGDSGSQAALTQQLLNAVRGLLTAQNQLYATYVNYLVIRLQLYRDMELMPLDARGVWIDEFTDATSTNAPPSNRVGDGKSEPERLPTPRELPAAPSTSEIP